jgi:hypothetical protein
MHVDLPASLLDCSASLADPQNRMPAHLESTTPGALHEKPRLRRRGGQRMLEAEVAAIDDNQWKPGTGMLRPVGGDRWFCPTLGSSA